MKKSQLDKNQFAAFMMAEATKNVQQYIFDVFYDIKTIMNTNQEKLEAINFPTKEPVFQTFYWFLRKTGTYMCAEEDQTCFKSYVQNSSIGYKLTFCLNSDYFFNQEFCEVSTINLNQLITV